MMWGKGAVTETEGGRMEGKEKLIHCEEGSTSW